MLEFSIRRRTQVLDTIIQQIETTPQHIQQVTADTVLPAMQEYVVLRLAPYPPPIGKGVFKMMATPAQRRAVMAKIRRGEWMGRTGALGRSWRAGMEPLDDGARIRIRNVAPYAAFVVGIWQQPFHTHTLWPDSDQQRGDMLRTAAVAFSAGVMGA